MGRVIHTIGEADGFTVTWNEALREATLDSDDWLLRRVLRIDSDEVELIWRESGITHSIHSLNGVAPFLYDDRAYLRYDQLGFVTNLDAWAGLYQGYESGHFRFIFTRSNAAIPFALPIEP